MSQSKGLTTEDNFAVCSSTLVAWRNKNARRDQRAQFYGLKV